MKAFYTKSKVIRKTATIMILLMFSVVLSILINYKNVGVFNIETKKLPIYNVETNEKKISLTFDVSWGEDYTIKILDILDKYNVKATFFIVGGWIDENPELVKEIFRRGHEIGNHSNKHPDMTKLSRDKMIQEIAACDAKIMSITGETPNLFRCPSGEYNDLVIDTVSSTKHFCIQWDVDSIDWKNEGMELEYNRIMKNTKPGSILLFHNTGKYTTETLPRVISNLKKAGYTFVKVTDIIYKDNYQINYMGKQIHN